MDNNPGETPNPLNPNPNEHEGLVSEPDSIPSENVKPTRRSISVVDSFISSSNEPGLASAAEPTQPAVEPSPVEEATPAPEIDPLDRPMEQAPAAEAKPAKKKKTGLIIGAIICFLIAVGLVVAAVFFFFSNGEDAVSKAFSKLLDNGAPANITVDGTANLSLNGSDSPFSNLNASFNSSIMTASGINTTAATIGATLKDSEEQIELGIEEIYAANGELYLKVDGLSDVLSIFAGQGVQSQPALQDCLTDEAGADNCTVEELETIDCEVEADCADVEVDSTGTTAIYSAIADAVEGKWLRMTSDELEGFDVGLDDNESLSCMVEMLSGASNNSNSIKKLYQDNPFVISAKGAPVIASKQNQVYRLAIDDEKFTSFVNAANSSSSVSDLFSCMGYEDAQIDASDLLDDIDKMPEVYVEVDRNFDFTRLFVKGASEDGEVSAVLDLNFSYPTNINVSEPTEYTDLSTVIQNISIDATTEE